MLNYISNMRPNYSLSLKQISLKLVTLLTLLAIRRVESIPSFTVDNVILTQNYLHIFAIEATEVFQTFIHQ